MNLQEYQIYMEYFDDDRKKEFCMSPITKEISIEKKINFILQEINNLKSNQYKFDKI